MGRPIIGLALGTGTTPTPDSSTSELSQFLIHMQIGLRLSQRTQAALQMGIETFSVDQDRISVGAFDLGMQARYAVPLGLIEPVLGARVRGRLRFADHSQIPEEEGGIQAGFGLAPTVGLQWPWLLNRHDTRLVVYLEAVPEWSFWTTPSISDGIEAPIHAALNEALLTADFSIGTLLGVRFEL